MNRLIASGGQRSRGQQRTEIAFMTVGVQVSNLFLDQSMCGLWVLREPENQVEFGLSVTCREIDSWWLPARTSVKATVRRVTQARCSTFNAWSSNGKVKVR